MNLIEKLGLEKCKAIVDGVPEGCDAYETDTHVFDLDELRAAIADHEHNYVVGLEVLRDCDIPPNTIILER